MSKQKPERDARVDPKPGDVLRYGKTRSEVIDIVEEEIWHKANEVAMRGPLKLWIRWAKNAEVLHAAD